MYLIIGANGFLGSTIISEILKNSSDFIIATSRTYKESDNKRLKWIKFDINLDSPKLEDYFYNVNFENLKVIFLAAYHNPDLVEKNKEIAWETNILSLVKFLNANPKIKYFIYPSSDSVYGESINNYHFKECDVTNPLNLYGYQKLIAERIVNSYGFSVIRFPFLFGPSSSLGKKHFFDLIKSNLEKNTEIFMFEDYIRSVIDFETASNLLIRILEEQIDNLPRILNISSDYDLSKYDIGKIIAEKLNVDMKLVIPIKQSESNGIFSVKRSNVTLLDNTLLKNLLKIDKIALKFWGDDK